MHDEITFNKCIYIYLSKNVHTICWVLLIKVPLKMSIKLKGYYKMFMAAKINDDLVYNYKQINVETVE